MITRTLLVSSVIAVAGLGLIGVGSNATFTQDTVSSQTIMAGTMKVVISEGAADANSTAALTLPAFGPTNSSFTTGDRWVTITNKGNITVQEIKSTPGFSASTNADWALANQVYLCEVSLNPQNQAVVIYNGLLKDAVALDIQGSLVPTATDAYSANYYAGKVHTACGAVTAVGALAPIGGGDSDVPSLNNFAQGGAITPTMTVSYTG